MDIVPLTNGSFGELIFTARVGLGHFTSKTHMPFVVDTGATGTIILPYHEGILRAELATLARQSKIETVQTLFGELKVRRTSGLTLFVHGHPDRIVRITDVDICFTAGGVRKTARKINYNLLGRNVLEKFAFYMDQPGIKNLHGNPNHPIAFLARPGEEISGALRSSQDQDLRSFLAPATPPREPEDVIWDLPPSARRQG